MVEGDHGKLLRLAALRDEFFEMMDEDPRTAGRDFLDKYGTDVHAIVATAQTTSSRLGTPMTKAGVAWVLEHPGIEDDLPYTYGMFAPVGGPDDFALYREEVRKGERIRRDPERWNELLNHTKGNVLWDEAQRQVEGRSDRAAQQWLRDVADDLRAEYPGWGDTTGNLEGTDTEQLVDELGAPSATRPCATPTPPPACVSTWRPATRPSPTPSVTACSTSTRQRAWKAPVCG